MSTESELKEAEEKQLSALETAHHMIKNGFNPDQLTLTVTEDVMNDQTKEDIIAYVLLLQHTVKMKNAIQSETQEIVNKYQELAKIPPKFVIDAISKEKAQKLTEQMKETNDSMTSTEEKS